ncbi:Large subunit GTPase 1 -like protein [Toxocara canis]|uniref:Large subunit GTPase 1 homolog n=1 Tax=Toxocara canis TaxID=6265 RepID=A0A0B2V4T0_TOXCA|nr:Large subunit GTPase 1 -like protein [Toxocara canis]
MTKRRPSTKKRTGLNGSLGNSLFNDREKARVNHRGYKLDDSGLENAAFLDYAKVGSLSFLLNAKSFKKIEITEETSLDEFLAKAQLAGTEFTAERGDFRVLEDSAVRVVPRKKDVTSTAELQKAYQHRLLIPRRPRKELWETPDELLALENENFLQWRKGIAELQEVDGLVLTPFERNLELWRQLWRVIERSDIVVQIVDARNPLLFRNIDFETYVKECDVAKQNVLLINKADLLTAAQIDMWRRWLVDNNVEAIFWSALEPELDSLKEEVDEEEEEEEEASRCEDSVSPVEDSRDRESIENEKSEEGREHLNSVPFLRSPDELISYLKRIGCASSLDDGSRPLIVGMVGYPNVGKSSTINRILGTKKVSVSATPGKTRHLQTLIVDSQITLCDCPGLVMPSFVFNRAEMLLNGILPVDHMREHFEPIALLASRVPRFVFEKAYSVMLPKATEHEQDSQPPTAHELLTSVAYMRGFMAASGVPDCSRAARLIVKDVVNGRLKWIAAPPGMEQSAFDNLTYPADTGNRSAETPNGKGAVHLQQLERRRLIEGRSSAAETVDRQFFTVSQGSAHVRTIRGIQSDCERADVAPATHSKGSKKHHNKGKKEKLRRIYADQ